MNFSSIINLDKPYALYEKNGTLHAYQGTVHKLKALDDIHRLSLETGKDIVFLLPYNTIRERGFEAHGNDPILAMEANFSFSCDKTEFINSIDDVPVNITEEITPSINDDDYARMIADFQENEIGGGNTSQTILSRKFEGRFEKMDNAQALSIYRRLLQSKGAYMTVLFANIDSKTPQNSHFIISATPERHLEISGNETIMNPIAGTLRKEDEKTFAARLNDFVHDEKEISELFQVLDEEMKIMGSICPQGGEIRGPILREIGAVVHSEYELVGRRSPNTIAALRQSLHAPTVTGSPVESAARIIAKYEGEPRGYYSGEAGIYKTPRTKDHYGDLDTAILIRCIEAKGDGKFHVRAGGGLVKYSDPYSEAKESHAKAMGVLAAVTGSNIINLTYLSDKLYQKIRPALEDRNKHLSAFWTQKQNPYAFDAHKLKGLKITVLNNEDNFAFMIKHMLDRLGAVAEVIDTENFAVQKDQSDIIIVGPGPGDPNDMSHKRMKKLQDILKKLRPSGKPILGVCLGHQALAVYEGLNVARQADPTQGEMRNVKIFGTQHQLGFYNSFAPQYDESAKERSDIRYDLDEDNNIIAMQAESFIGFQFHPESVMSKGGFELLTRALVMLQQMRV